MRDDQKKYVGELCDDFLSDRFSKDNPEYKEVLLRGILLSKRWDYLRQDIKNNYAVLNLSLIKKEVEKRFSEQNISLEFLCDTGFSLYSLHSKIQNLDKFMDSYNKIIIWWVKKYVWSLKNADFLQTVNLSYENGLCCLISYLLLYETLFSEQLEMLTGSLLRGIQNYLGKEEINFGMRNGMGGYLNTLNSIKRKNLCHQELNSVIRSIVNLYNENKTFYDGVVQWPAVKKANGEVKSNIADTWSYGASMILFNLLSVDTLNIEEKDNYYKMLKSRSYLPVGDFYLIKSDFYSGYAGTLSVFDMCDKKYADINFKLIKERLIDKVLESAQKKNIFLSYEYKIVSGHLEMVKQESDQVNESYRIYNVLCNAMI